MPVCDTSDAPFTLYSNVGIQSPGITTVSGPTSVPINKSATWTIYAHDPQNQQLSFVVSWDDGTIMGFTPSDAEQSTALSQGIQVSHTYTEARTYKPSFKVINTSGLSTVNSMAVYSKHGE